MTYIRFCPHTFIVSRVAALTVARPTVQVAASPSLEVVVNLVDDVLVGHIPHHLAAAQAGQPIPLPLLVDEVLQVIVTASSVPGICVGQSRCRRFGKVSCRLFRNFRIWYLCENYFIVSNWIYLFLALCQEKCMALETWNWKVLQLVADLVERCCQELWC